MLKRAGRYSIRRRIGFGGMGEVFLAEDEKLGRKVAIKTIPDSMIGNRDLQSRLREEAKTIALMNHPSVAQIHDLISEGGRHFLVLEYVEGTTLAEMLHNGPVAEETAVEIAVEIAEGLAAAHAQGIVHRDLKPENIMVTPAGNVKILDFGLATVRIRTEDGPDDAPMPGFGIAGTLSAMSPEQAEGRRVEAASDLFSFGILLYQMLTGVHPFRTSVPVETLQRIQSFDPQAPVALNPAVSSDLSDLVLSLLEKDPDRRPRSASGVVRRLQEVRKVGTSDRSRRVPASDHRPRSLRRILAVTSVIVVAGTLFVYLSSRSSSFLPPFTVAILEPVEEPGSTNLTPPSVVSGMRLAAVNAMNTIEGAQVINLREIDAVSGGARTIARAVAADELIAISFSPGEETFSVEIDRLSGDETRILWARRFNVPARNLALLADTVAANLEAAYPMRRQRRGAFRVTADPEAYEGFLKVWKEIMSPSPNTSWIGILEELREILASAPELLNAAVLEASVARYLFETTGNDQYLEQAEEALRTARAIAPDDLRTLLAKAEIAIAAGDYENAGAVLDRLEKIDPGNIAAERQRARLAEKRGDAAGARRILAAIVERSPSWRNLLNLAKIERFLGDIDAARAHLEEAERRAPSNLPIQVDRAFLELFSGDPEKAEQLFLRIVAEAPEAQHLANLGTAQLLLHHFSDALVSFQRAFALGSKSPVTMLNMADCNQLSGEKASARTWYRRTLEALPKDRPLFAEELEIRAQAQAQLGRTNEALVSIETALERDSDSPSVLYAATLVYAIAGLPDRARSFHARAVRAGLNPRWFDLPWFHTSGADAGPSGVESRHSPIADGHS